MTRYGCHHHLKSSLDFSLTDRYQMLVILDLQEGLYNLARDWGTSETSP